MYRIQELLTQYQNLKEEDPHTLEQSYMLLSQMHEIIHQRIDLTLTWLLFAAAQNLKVTEVPEFESAKWKALKKEYQRLLNEVGKAEFSRKESLPSWGKYRWCRDELHWRRQKLASSLTAALTKVCQSIDSELMTTGFNVKQPSWPFYFTSLYKHFGDKPVKDFLQIKDTPELFEDLAHKVLEEAKGTTIKKTEMNLREYDRGIPFLAGLAKLKSPMTWGEVLYHFICECGDKATLNQLGHFFSYRRRCIECDELFEAKKYNPGVFRCHKCSNKLAVRRFRKKEQHASTPSSLSRN
ncbi:MAG: hypothetical protein OEW82_04160 [Dehalococcoidia bacterium]|nr:hypothetical protein [Dehalococcoidia bacterium]